MIRAGRSVLITLALMLASAGAMRFGAGVGAAMAAGEPDTVADAPVNCPVPPLVVTQTLIARETRVAAREQALAERLSALDLADAAIQTRLAELQTAEESLSRLVTMADGAAEGDLDRLTAVYEAMKPTDAARLFSAMTSEFAAGFLGRMKPVPAAAILAGMPPDAAFAVSALIAGRNARAPTD